MKTPMFEMERWGNAYATGYVYNFAWGKVIVEYEYSHADFKRVWLPCWFKQFGGDHIFQWSFGWFKRSISLRIWELD